MYNAEGELLIPFVIHKHRQIPEVLSKHFFRKVQFFPTEDGKLDHNCLCIAIHVIQLYVHFKLRLHYLKFFSFIFISYQGIS